MQTKILKRESRAQEQGKGAADVAPCFLQVCVWRLEACLQTNKFHKGEKQPKETSQGHYDICESE